MSSSPLTSVIIPVYNSELYLPEAIESVLIQHYRPIEIIVIDDGSTDSSAEVAKRFGPPVLYFRQNNMGPSVARNRGLNLSKGEYIVFLDGDDILLPIKLSKQIPILEKRPELGYVHSGWHIIDQQSSVIGTVEPWRNCTQLDLEAWLLWHPVFLGATLFRRHWVEQTGGFDSSLHQAEDTEFFLRLALMGCPAVWLKQPTVCYRRNEHSLTRNGLQRAECVNRVVSNFFSRPGLSPEISQLENEVRYNILLWCVWQLYSTGHASKITQYLRESLKHRVYSPLRTVQRWLGQLIIECRKTEGCDIEELRSLWPYFRAAIDVDKPVWQKIECFLDWILQAELQVQVGRQMPVDLS